MEELTELTVIVINLLGANEDLSDSLTRVLEIIASLIERVEKLETGRFP